MANKILVAFVLMFASATFAQDAPGLYLDRGGEFVKLDHASLSGSGSRGVAKSIFVPGATPSVVWEYRGAEATVRAGASPRFVYQLRDNQTIADRDFVMVRMDQKSDRREIRVGKQSGWTGNVRAGFDAKKLIDLRITHQGRAIVIEPVVGLAPGEYFLTAGFSSVGYDFGVHWY
jgi:hypothetical protein